MPCAAQLWAKMPVMTGGEKPVLLTLWLRLIGPVSNISFLQPHQTERYSSEWQRAPVHAWRGSG